MKTPEKDQSHPAEAEQCLARSVADTLAEEPTLEAVTIDPAHKKISVATLGRTDVDRLPAPPAKQFYFAAPREMKHPASLLSGKRDCSVCGSPLSATERKRITIQQDGDATTIARVTCPTA